MSAESGTGPTATIISATAQAAPSRPLTLLAPWAATPIRPPSTASVVVLLADPIRDTRELLAAGLTASGIGRVILAESTGAVEGILSEGLSGHLAMVSLAFGDGAGRLIRQLRSANWDRVLALAPTGDPTSALSALQAGACGVLRGHPKAPTAELPPLVHELSEREIEVLADVADGRSNKWIGDHLSLSALTVKSHLARISRKLGTGDRAHMVAIAMRAGLVR